MINKTFALCAPIYLEHNYINFFVEYHISLGFDMIYLLIDNSTIIQNDYLINEKLLPYVKLYYITKEEAINDINNCIQKYEVVHNKMINTIYPDISEDYVILSSLDAFLFLDNLTLREYFTKNNISDDTAQIFFRWKCLINMSFKSEYNILKDVNSKNIESRNYDHFFTMGNKKLVEKPTPCCHMFITSTNTNAMYEGHKFIINKLTGVAEIFNKLEALDGIVNNLPHNHVLYVNNNKHNSYIYHFMSRNIQDVFIKSYYYWKKNHDENRIDMIREIVFNNRKELSRDVVVKSKSENSSSITDVIFKPDNTHQSTYNFDESLFNKILEDCNISLEDFNKWFLSNLSNT